MLSRSYDHDVLIAKEKESQNLIDNNVYTCVTDEGQNYVESRWVLTEKDDESGQKTIKARLVAKGFQDESDVRTDSPTCDKSSVRLLFTVAATNQWKVCSLDIKAAFLQGRQLQREVYVKPPPEFGTGILWKLNKAMYGLNDASREWYLQVIESMKEMHAQRSAIDDAIFYWKREGVLVAMSSCHVDDFTLTGTPALMDEIQTNIKQRFEISSESEGVFKYLGLEIHQYDTCISMSQQRYISEIELLQIPDRSSDSNLTNNEKRSLRSLAGQLNWVSSQSRPDIAFGSCEVNTSMTNGKVKDLSRANKVIKQLKSDDVKIFFHDLREIQELVCYSDASYASLPGGASQGAYILFLKGSNGKYVPIAWKSNKIRRTVKSTLAAESLAMQEGADHSYVIMALVKEITGRELILTMRTDSDSLQKNLRTTNKLTEKRLNMDLMVIREMVERKEIHNIEWVPTDVQLADCMTKKGADKKKLLQALSGRWEM